jgi:glycine cleavage system H lipoate-binding protein
MRCPFLREAQVKFCHASAYRKLIPRNMDHAELERCSSAAYESCPTLRQHREEGPRQSHCPFLHESLVQYCSAAPVTKYVPYSESLITKCGNDSHRYCELYLSMAEPPSDGGNSCSDEVDGIRVPDKLAYSSNHMWMDIAEDGSCHVGVDAFCAKILSPLERAVFVPTRSHPSVVLTTGSVDLQMTFPTPFLLTGMNSLLRTKPERLNADPYVLGWLFEGKVATQGFPGSCTCVSDLRTGGEARTWMQREVQRMNAFVHDLISSKQVGGVTALADGGTFADDFVRHLSREEIRQLHNRFFSTESGMVPS